MADRYWVGGTGNWDASTTTNWSASSGGAGGASVPTSSDNVIFNSLSNATAYTVTITATANCADFTMAGPLVGAVTWAGSSALNIYGSMNLSGGTSGITRTYTGLITYKATTTGKTQTLNSVTLASAITFDGVGGGWTFNDTVSTTGIITLTRGTLNTNGVSVTASSISSSNSNTRTLTLGASTINVNEVGGGWNTTTITGLTFNANTSTINFGATTPRIESGGVTFYNVAFTGVAGAAVNAGVDGSNIFNDLTITKNSTASAGLFYFAANQTINGTLTINGNTSTTARIFIKSNTLGTARTLTAATVTVTNADFQDITGTGAGSWNLSAITGNSGDCGGNSGITFTTPVTTNWVSGATWSTATWSSRVPLPQDTATFTTAGTVTITQNMPRIGSVDFTGSSNKTWTTSTNTTVYGSIDLTNLTALTASAQSWIFSGRGSNTLKSAGFTWAKGFTFDMGTGSMTLSDAFVGPAGDSITFSTGTFSANGFNVTYGQISSNTTTTRTINMGSGTWELTRAGATTAWFMNATGLTLNASTSTIKFTGSTNDAQTFAGAGKTYNNVWFARGASTASITVSGSNTFADIKDTGTVAHSLLFTAGTTQTVTTFTVNGTAGNLISINSTTTATHALVKTGGGTISCDYLNIQHSVATPASTWYAGVNSTNNQAVATAGSGWIFTAPPGGISTGGLLMFF